METMRYPESWNDLDMDWNDPDPAESCYYLAILAAIDERMRAMTLSGIKWYEYRFFTGNRYCIPSVESIRGIARQILRMVRDNGQFILIKDNFLNDTTGYSVQPPSMKEQVHPVFTYPAPAYGEQLSRAKDFLIWAKNTLDSMTMFLHPLIKITYYNPEEFDSINDAFWAEPELEGVEDEKKRLEIAASLFIRKHTDDIKVKSGIFQTFDLQLMTHADASNAAVTVTVKLPESIVVRSFARPHIYCLVKPKPVPDVDKWYFNDFGYGFENETNKVLDLGQITIEKDKKIDLFQYDLEQTRSHISAGDGVRHIFEARCYFASDYNCEGGFRFRPGA